jgi:hypothetical protein
VNFQRKVHPLQVLCEGLRSSRLLPLPVSLWNTKSVLNMLSDIAASSHARNSFPEFRRA